MTRDELLSGLAAQAEADPRVEALLLSGSLGRGEGDAWSDLDLVAVIAPDDLSAFVEGARDWVERATPLLVWRAPRPGLPLFNAITEGWLRCDLTVTAQGRVAGARDNLKVVLDRVGVLNALPSTLPRRAPDGSRLAASIEEFIRVLGLLPVVVGRGEYVVAASGAAMLRTHLINLMVEELGLPQPPGALHLSKLLRPADMQLLEVLPPIEATRESIIEAHRVLAAIFLPRAKRLLAQAAGQWPMTFEAATLNHLREALGPEWPAP